MKTEDIKKLLELYYDGRSSELEEKMLTEYFSSESIAPELMDEKLIFESIHSTNDIIIDGTLENKLDVLIDNLADKEIANSQQETLNKKKNHQTIYWFSGIAASIAILLSVVLLNDKPENSLQSPSLVLRDTYTDPNKAYAETEKALLLISSKLNKGLSGIDTFEEGIEKSNAIIDKNLKQIK